MPHAPKRPIHPSGRPLHRSKYTALSIPRWPRSEPITPRLRPDIHERRMAEIGFWHHPEDDYEDE